MTDCSFNSIYKGKTVLITGHTGFKGSWMSEWLLMLGAKVIGVSLEPLTTPSLFYQLNLDESVEKHIIGDIQDITLIHTIMQENAPDFVFHLAAQPLVLESYKNPVETFSTNIMGTISILDALRKLDKKCSAVFITTDKCYQNNEWSYGYREVDPLGGHDPYSASKAAAELVIASYRNSFFNNSQIAIASARAGNVIGGGDWADNRIVPDCIRNLIKGNEILVRNPNATRPWQHVIEPLAGYLKLGQLMYESLISENLTSLDNFTSSFNFGPALSSNQKVEALVHEVLKNWSGTWKDVSNPNEPHEANLLNLSIEKAHHKLGWSPVWNFEETINKSIEWYKNVHHSNSSEIARKITQSQITDYISDCQKD